MIDVLDHEFENKSLYDCDDYYVCSKCQIVVFENYDTHKIYIGNDWNKTPGMDNQELNIKCDEVIIKSIIE